MNIGFIRKYEIGSWIIILYGFGSIEELYINEDNKLYSFDFSYEGRIKTINNFTGNNVCIEFNETFEDIMVYTDRLGINDIFYTKDGCFFTNDINILLKICYPIKIDLKYLYEYLLYRYVSGGNTIFKNIKKIMQGSYIFVSNNKIKQVSYYDFKFKNNTKKLKTNIDTLYELLRESSLKSFNQNERVGILLSRGVDSNLIFGSLSDKKLYTITGDFEYEDYGEGDTLCYLRSHKNLDSERVYISFEEYYNSIKKTILDYGLPLNHPNTVCYKILYECAKKKGLDTLLSGEGADGFYGGISIYKVMHLYYLPKHLRILLYALINISSGIFKRIIDDNKINLINFIISGDIWNALEAYYSKTDSLFVKNLLGLNSNEIDNYRKKLYQNLCENDTSIVNLVNTFHIKTAMAEDPSGMLRFSRSQGIELQYPFLSKNCLNYSFGIPFKHKYKCLTTKYILKKMCERFLPKKIIYKRKSGFGVPLHIWMYEKKWYEEIVYNVLCRTDSEINRSTLNNIRDNFINKTLKHRDYEGIIWTLYNYFTWKDLFMNKR